MPEPQTYKEWMERKIAKLHSDMLGKESVNYKPAVGAESCAGCRWFNEPWQGETHGYCQLVSGEILGTDVCDRYETIAQATTTPPPEPEPTTAKAKFQHTVLTQKSHSLLKTNYAFEWALPADINADEFYLIKGVAATEGEFKSGDIFTPANLAFGAGGMSTAAMQGIGIIDIDHYHEPLPERYAKYGLEGVNGECGFLIDAAVSVNKVTDGDGKTKDLTQVEFIGYVTNKHVAELINDGKFIGTSVEDWSRSSVCDTDENGVPMNCSIEGSHFIHLGLILDETPDSHGTWVNTVTQDDLDQWERNAEKNAPQIIIMKKDARKLKGSHAFNWDKMKKHASRSKVYDLSDYLEADGTFTDGKEGIITYLTEDVSLDTVTAQKIADYLYEHPQERNAWQMEMMSAGDWVAWYTHIQTQKLESIIENQKKVLAKHGIKCLSCGNEAKTRTILRVRKTHVAKGEGGCPEGTSQDPDDENNCIETSIYITKNEDGTCPPGYEPNPDGDDCIMSSTPVVAKVHGVCPEGSIEDPDNPEQCILIQSHIDKPEGGCPEGWTDNPEDETQCIEVTADEVYEIIDMPEGGCPEGFTPINEGTQCTNEPETSPTTSAPVVDMSRIIKHLKKRHSISSDMEKDLMKMFGNSNLRKKTRMAPTALRAVSSVIEEFANREYPEEHLEAIDVDRELVNLQKAINFNRPGKQQLYEFLAKYRLALKHLKKLKKKED